MLRHGARLVSPDGSRRFFEQIGSADKELKIYPERLHEPHNDIGREQVLSDMQQWLDRHL